MRWLSIRTANIDDELRKTFERYGVASMQVCLSTNNYFMHQGNGIQAVNIVDSLLPWLTEQYDRAERKETWSLTMGVAITFFVAAELLFSIVRRMSGK